MFITALFIIARTWKQPRCPSADECIRKRWYIYTMEYYSAIKKNSSESVLLLHFMASEGRRLQEGWARGGHVQKEIWHALLIAWHLHHKNCPPHPTPPRRLLQSPRSGMAAPSKLVFQAELPLSGQPQCSFLLGPSQTAVREKLPQPEGFYQHTCFPSPHGTGPLCSFIGNHKNIEIAQTVTINKLSLGEGGRTDIPLSGQRVMGIHYSLALRTQVLPDFPRVCLPSPSLRETVCVEQIDCFN